MKNVLISLLCLVAFALGFGCDDGGQSESGGDQAAGAEVSGGESGGESVEAGSETEAGEEEPDEPVNPNDLEADDTKLYNRYWAAQRQLYGALVKPAAKGNQNPDPRSQNPEPKTQCAGSRWGQRPREIRIRIRVGLVEAGHRALPTCATSSCARSRSES